MEFICQSCGNSFNRNPSRVKHGRAKYCSRKCQYKENRIKLSKPKVEFQCLSCLKIFSIIPSKLTHKGSGKYCSRKCRDKHRKGICHPQFTTGDSGIKRGPNWQSQKRLVRKRDKNVCQNCFKFGNHIHHIIPFRIFTIKNYIKANELSNLTTLCDRCHRNIEIITKRCLP